MEKYPLAADSVQQAAAQFIASFSPFREPTLYGVTDGKAVGTYLEHKFQDYLSENYTYQVGNSASGIDFPGLGVDIKVTSSRQPQSSAPFKSANEKIYGLGYSIILFVYDKSDDQTGNVGVLDIQHAVFIDSTRTGDYQTSRGVRAILGQDGNADDLVAFFFERNLPVDEITASSLAEQVLKSPPNQGYLTISNALQWRLQYSRVIDEAGKIVGINRLHTAS